MTIYYQEIKIILLKKLLNKKAVFMKKTAFFIK